MTYRTLDLLTLKLGISIWQGEKEILRNTMFLDVINDRGISSDLAVDGIREPQSTQYIKNMITGEDIVMDIGANIGYYTLIMKKALKIYAIEPSSDNFRRLKRNIKLNDCRNVDVINMAIGDRNGKTYLNISEKGNLNTIREINRKFINKEKIKVMNSDSFIKQINKTPTFIRMDVEGYEYNIIKGMKNILSSKAPLKIFIELHPHIMKKEETIFVLKTLKNNGFEIKKMFRCYTVAEMPFKKDIEWNYKIDDVLEDNEILEGRKGAFEAFFER